MIEEGCMDSNAINFNPDAEEDDGSCIYPSTAEKLAGSWTGTIVTTKTEAETLSTSSESIDLVFVADGSGTYTDRSGASAFTWTAEEDVLTIIIGENGEANTYTITTNEDSTQIWETSYVTVSSGDTVSISSVYTLSKG